MRNFTLLKYNLFKDTNTVATARKNSLPNKRKWTDVKVAQKPRELKKKNSSVMNEFNEEYKRAPYSTPDMLTLMYNKQKNLFLSKCISQECLSVGVRLEHIDQINHEIRKFSTKTY